MQFSKFFRDIKMKIYRIRDFPESVAIGLAWGSAISFTPLLGFHLIICYLGTIAMRGNLVAATVGSVIGNPWTFPFFWASTIWTKRRPRTKFWFVPALCLSLINVLLLFVFCFVFDSLLFPRLLFLFLFLLLFFLCFISFY